MDKRQAQELIGRFTKKGGTALTNHFKGRMEERGVSIDDVLGVLNWGEVTDLSLNPDHCNWECKVVGKDLDGEPLTLKVGIDENRRILILVTVF